ncbi:MAG: alpha/beta hydrolase fold domain-containing protein [Deltaproteobacteria bacterium]|nr:alpha/beta hydrolase fold domain-containing protein [Deltaproteobacteria bacterium]
MLPLVLRALCWTWWGRLRRGPARPSWTWRLELALRLSRLRAAAIERLDVRGRRLALERGARPLPPRLVAAVERQRLALGHLEAERLAPVSGSSGAAILYLHGGSFSGGSSRTHRELLARLCLAARAAVFAPDYRLAPEYRYPAAIDDAVAIYRQLLDRGLDPRRLALAGDEAGGNLALALLQRLRDGHAPLPAAAALLSPWVDLAASGGSLVDNAACDLADPEDLVRWAELYAPRAEMRHPLVSPLYADLRGLPPLLVEVGGAEILRDQVREFVDRARGQGVEVDFTERVDMVHDCYLLAGQLDSCARALQMVGEWIAGRLAGASVEALLG